MRAQSASPPRTHADSLTAPGDQSLSLGPIGPTGDLLAPLGPLGEDEAVDVFIEQIEGLREGGADVGVRRRSQQASAAGPIRSPPASTPPAAR